MGLVKRRFLCRGDRAADWPGKMQLAGAPLWFAALGNTAERNGTILWLKVRSTEGVFWGSHSRLVTAWAQGPRSAVGFHSARHAGHGAAAADVDAPVPGTAVVHRSPRRSDGRGSRAPLPSQWAQGTAHIWLGDLKN